MIPKEWMASSARAQLAQLPVLRGMLTFSDSRVQLGTTWSRLAGWESHSHVAPGMIDLVYVEWKQHLQCGDLLPGECTGQMAHQLAGSGGKGRVGNWRHCQGLG